MFNRICSDLGKIQPLHLVYIYYIHALSRLPKSSADILTARATHCTRNSLHAQLTACATHCCTGKLLCVELFTCNASVQSYIVISVRSSRLTSSCSHLLHALSRLSKSSAAILTACATHCWACTSCDAKIMAHTVTATTAQ